MPRDSHGNVVAFDDPKDAKRIDIADDIANNNSADLADKLFERDVNVMRAATAVLNDVGSYATNGSYKQLPVLDDKAVERMHDTFVVNFPPAIEGGDFNQNDYVRALSQAAIGEYMGEKQADSDSFFSLMKATGQMRYPLDEDDKTAQNVYMAARAADAGVAVMGDYQAYEAIAKADRALAADPMASRLAQAQAVADNVVDTPSGPDNGLSY